MSQVKKGWTRKPERAAPHISRRIFSLRIQVVSRFRPRMQLKESGKNSLSEYQGLRRRKYFSLKEERRSSGNQPPR